MQSTFNKGLKEKLGRLSTPFYYYDLDLLNATIERSMQEATRYGYFMHYALKANSNPRILEILSKKAFGADCVSGNEISRALETGFNAKDIVFAGVGKSDTEINHALQEGIGCIHAESLQELEVINELAGMAGLVAPVALRIIPGVDALTHRYITTGLEENKFGILPWQFDTILENLGTFKNIRFSGLHFHIGSQITDLNVFKSLCKRVNEINTWFFGRGFTADVINVGGGLGVDYGEPDKCSIPDFASYFRIFHDFIELHGRQELHFEPGRAIIAQCGSLISRVLFVKEGINTRFAIIDAGMNDLIRPALYQSFHKIENLTSAGEKLKYDVVGPVCESSDCFGKAVIMPETRRGDLIAIRSAGAYGQTMASRYNLRDLAAEVYSDEV